MKFLRSRLPWVMTGFVAGIALALFVRAFASSVASQVHAVEGTATFTGSTASFSATFTQGGNQPIRTAFGPLRLDYKSGPDTWTTGLLIREGDGNVTVGAGITTADFNSTSKLRVLGVVESTTGGFKFPDGTTQTTAAAGAGNVPNGAMAYFNAACPTGWSEVTGARGRVVVGVPASGTLAGTVGTALTNLENRTHVHTTQDHTLTIAEMPAHTHADNRPNGNVSAGILSNADAQNATNPAPQSGSTGGGGGHNHGDTTATSATMPYIQYRVCQYDGNSGADASTWGNSGNNIYSLNSGNVGIGSTTPGAKLEVAGNINSSTGALQTAGVTRIDNSGVGTFAAGTTIGGNAVAPVDNSLANGRLTLTSATPVTTADVTAATTVYYTPYNGNRISLYDGTSAWTTLTFSELSLALTNYTANTNYDIWAYNNSGTVALESTAWTNDTTRATAIVQQNGVWVKSGTTTRRLLGTIRITGTTGQTEDSLRKRYVSNVYNKVPRKFYRTLSWSVNAGGYSYSGYWNNDSNEYFGLINPTGDSLIVNISGMASISTTSYQSNAYIILGVDSYNSGGTSMDETNLPVTKRISWINFFSPISVGFHYVGLGFYALDDAPSGSHTVYTKAMGDIVY